MLCILNSIRYHEKCHFPYHDGWTASTANSVLFGLYYPFSDVFKLYKEAVLDKGVLQIKVLGCFFYQLNVAVTGINSLLKPTCCP